MAQAHELLRKVKKSCMAFLCDPGWYVNKPDVQHKWDDNIHTHHYGFMSP